MKRTLAIISCAMLALVGMAASGTVAREGRQVRGDCRFSWVVPKTNTDGTPLDDIKEYHLFISRTRGRYNRAEPIIIPYPISEHSCDAAKIIMDGQYYATLIVIDQAGNQSNQSTEQAFYRDTSVPRGSGRLDILGFERIQESREGLPPGHIEEAE